jgi:predicted phage baseplate assembly protein
VTLPAPNLDDRRFQDLVDDAKRLVQRRCPEWTDHNVSDPGVTLIETFAYVVDQVLYRLNRVPERSYVTFLDLMGVELFAPSAARVEVTLWLTAEPEEDRVVEAATEVATRRRRTSEAIVFTTIEDLHILRTRRVYVMTGGRDGQPFDQSGELANERPVAVFSATPQVDDTLLIGLDRAAPHCAIALHVECEAEGHGIDPTDPPWVWEALAADGWHRCDVEDHTGGFNTPGDIVIHVPGSHVEAVVEERSAGWLRCRVVAPRNEDQTSYTDTPLITGLEAGTTGGTVTAVHGADVLDELVGVSEGVPGQRFELLRKPVVASERPVVLEVAGEQGWEPWQQVTGFGESGPDDPHWRLNANEGTVIFGPAVRLADGSIRQYGAVPPAGAHIRVRRYRTGGGREGNIAAHEIVTLKSAIPFVGQVDNRRPAVGGVDGETLTAAKTRGPLVLGTRNRAVTARDYEQLAREATPEVARVRCLPVDSSDRPTADDGGATAGVRVLIVPAVAADESGRIAFDQLVPSPAMMTTVRDYLDERRMIGARVAITPPRYLGVTAVIRLRARLRADPEQLRQDALDALYRYFDPLRGGPEGEGWAFGRPILLGEVFGVAQRVEGVDLIEDARMFPADPITGQRGESVTRIDLDPDSLVFSYGHQVQVVNS